MSKAYMKGRAVTIAPPESVGGPPFLVVQIEISCGVCGDQEFLIAGHHLKPLLSILQEFIAAEPPELTDSGDVDVVSTRMFHGVWDPGNDSGNSGNN